MRRVAVVALLAALALATACGEGTDATSSPPVRPVGGFSVEGLHARARVLDQATLAADSFHPDELDALLSGGGYVTGRERELTGKTKTFDHVVLRSLVFGEAKGAEAYLDWLRAHPDEVLGQSTRAEVVPPPSDDGFVLKLVACGTCKKELPTYFAAWRVDSRAFTLLAAGSGAGSRIQSLVERAGATVD